MERHWNRGGAGHPTLRTAFIWPLALACFCEAASAALVPTLPAGIFLCLALMKIGGRLVFKRLFLLVYSVLAVTPFSYCQPAWTKPGDSCAHLNPGAASPWDSWMQAPATQPRGNKGNFATDWFALASDATVRETPRYPSFAAFDVEGPYCQTTAQFTNFRLTIQYLVIAGRVTPKFLPTAPGLTPPSDTNRSTDQDFGNSGIYIFDRWEVQIIDPSQFDDSNNKAAYGTGVPTGRTILPDPYIGTMIDKSTGKRKAFDTNDLNFQRNVNVPGALYGVTPVNNPLAGNALYINQANPAGQWNSLDITFCAPTLTADTPPKIKTPPRLSSKLNGQTVYYGPVPGNGTGSRAKLGALNQGPIFLQSHWGSDVQFRMPTITVIDTSMNPCSLP